MLANLFTTVNFAQSPLKFTFWMETHLESNLNLNTLAAAKTQ